MKTKILALTALLTLGAIAPAHAQPAAQPGHQFSGRCVGSGLLTFTRPLTAAPSVAGIEFVSSGTCTGTVDGVPVQETRYVGRTGADSALLSCEAGAVAGGGAMTFPDLPGQPSIQLRFSDLNVTGLSGFLLQGADAGVAIGQHQLTPDLALVTACLTDGVDQIGNTISFATLTPLRG